MKAELATLAVSLLVGMSTCSVSVWSYDKASPEDRIAFLTKEALKLGGRTSVRQQDFARIFDVRPNANARTVSVQQESSRGTARVPVSCGMPQSGSRAQSSASTLSAS